MTINTQESQVVSQEATQNDKEENFRLLHRKYQKELEAEREARIQAEEKIAQLSQKTAISRDDDDDDEPYVDRKKLNRELNKFSEQTKQVTQTEIKKAIDQAIAEERRQAWLKSNSDFEQVMLLADKLPEVDPDLAETLLAMPAGFERQKLAYKSIKALGLHKPLAKEPSIQERIDQNKRSPYYQPSGTATAPYASQGNFSPSGQKDAYEKMMQLKANMKLG